MKSINIYTDGACSGNQNEENIGGWGCILEFGPHIKELWDGEVNTTNNRMELSALIAGLSALKEKGLEIHIYSDSSYLINCFKNKWYVNWQKNGWVTSSRSPVENQDLWKRLLELTEGQTLLFNLVKGHLSLKDPQSPALKKSYAKFCEHNGSFTYEEFLYIVEKNNRADELANMYAKKLRGERKE